MPDYKYECPHCFCNWEVFKKMAEYETAEHCPTCYKIGERVISSPSVPGTSTSFKPFHDISLGQTVHSAKEIDKICEEKNVEYVKVKDFTPRMYRNPKDEKREDEQEIRARVRKKLQEKNYFKR